VAAGGLISYGGRITDSCGWLLAGVYTGRILEGHKPAELPVNLKTAQVFGLTVPPSLIALCRRGDRVKSGMSLAIERPHADVRMHQEVMAFG
jgi:hypothetical protein